MLRLKSFRTAAVTLNYAEGPESGPPMLLLHGVTQRWEEFLPLIPTLSQIFHIYAVDFRGHGKSGRVPRGYHGEEYCADIAQFVVERIAEPVYIFGHSLGGMVASYLAGQIPDRVRAIMLGDNIIYAESLDLSSYPQLFKQVYELVLRRLPFPELCRELAEMSIDSPLVGPVKMKQIPGCDQAYLNAYARSLTLLDPDTLAMIVDKSAWTTWDPEVFLKRVQCPTLLMQADSKWGGIMSDRDVALAKSSIEEVTHVRLEGLGHALHMQQSQPVLRTVLNFLQSLE